MHSGLCNLLGGFVNAHIINIVDGLFLIILVWLINNLIPRLSKYKLVIVDRESWEAFKRTTPLIHALVTNKDIKQDKI